MSLGDGGFGVAAQELVAFVGLAVDVGLHDRGWSHRQAIDAVLQWTPLPEFAAKELVLRSICDPGRVALPAIGLLRFRTLRTTVTELLGDAFDTAGFHAALLEGGPIVLDARIDRWLQLQRRAPAGHDRARGAWAVPAGTTARVGSLGHGFRGLTSLSALR